MNALRHAQVTCLPLALLATLISPAAAVTVVAPVTQDATLFEDALGALSGGAGGQLMVGRVGTNDSTPRRRTVIQFDVSSIPAGSVITGATLTLNVFKIRQTTATSVEAHRVAASWSAGTVNPGTGGQGSAAAPGDATWLHRSSPATWTSAGGDFLGTTSGSQSVGDLGLYSWSGVGMVADVQAWIDNPAQNFGWILIGDESAAFTVKEFNSADSASNRPILTITYAVVPEPTTASFLALGIGCMARRRRFSYAAA